MPLNLTIVAVFAIFFFAGPISAETAYPISRIDGMNKTIRLEREPQNISSKTLFTNEALDQFIRETYPEIIRRVPSKYIAQFIGITPESYSRLLKRQLQKS